jgi:7-dehydrocholesterol reductase
MGESLLHGEHTRGERFMDSQSSAKAGFGSLMRGFIGPLLLVTLCPPTALLIWYTHTSLGGSVMALWHEAARVGGLQLLASVWLPVMWGSKTAWAIIGAFAVTQLFLMRVLPGPDFHGPETPKGHVPVYKANGVAAFVVTLALFCGGSFGLHLFPASIIYDHFGAIIGALNTSSLVICLLLMLKGRFAPSGPDHGVSGRLLFDYYWGTELYPRILGFDIKQFTNCRFGMMSWPIILLSFAAAQHDRHGVLSDSMIVAVALQLFYVAKFFWWETGYLRSLDIMHDRAGFYICWGCLVWVPCVYTSSTLYLVDHPNVLGLPVAALIFALGVLSISINYLADRQRQQVRATNGRTTVWGKPPVLVDAPYVNERGEHKRTVLLASGWWGLGRHFHYIPEILGAAFWTLPGLFVNFLPWFYVIFLTILLVDRANRDDQRCKKKYGPVWDTYCRLVPNKILPRFGGPRTEQTTVHGAPLP